jgi:glutathione synthase/RimK-type ligase-like ATP-grasp enzyme
VVIQKHTGNAMLVIKVVDGETGKMVALGGSQKRNAQQLLEGWTFKDGHPCGVKEES